MTAKRSVRRYRGVRNDELRALEERYRHELMDEEDRDRLRCRILKIKAAGR